MSILITGGSGKLGRELVKVFDKAIAPSRSELDILNTERLEFFFQKYKPKIIIHTAALTGIRQCEENKRLAWETNYQGTKNLIEAGKKLKNLSYFIYISTACVFYGDKKMYTENDLPHPKNYYSLTKLLGELAVQNSYLTKWLILRTNFIAREPWPYPQAFTDRFGTYLFAKDVAEALKEIIAKKLTGILHLCGDKKMSVYELARLVSPKVKPTTLKSYKGPPLTINMTLDTKRWKRYSISKS